jgi:hypothetical protein
MSLLLLFFSAPLFTAIASDEDDDCGFTVTVLSCTAFSKD